MSEAQEKSTKELAREILRGTRVATLATRLAGEEDVTDQPYASKILLASGHDGAPLLLLSDLAQHGRNLAASSRASLLLDPSGGEDLDQPRLILMGDVQTLDESPAEKPASRRYQRLHPGSERYAGFGDFRLYRMDLTALHLVAGFGRVRWFEPAEVLPTPRLAAAFTESEEALLQNHAAIVDRLVPATGDSWHLAGLDCDGVDLLTENGKKDDITIPSHKRIKFPQRLKSVAELAAALEQLKMGPD